MKLGQLSQFLFQRIENLRSQRQKNRTRAKLHYRKARCDADLKRASTWEEKSEISQLSRDACLPLEEQLNDLESQDLLKRATACHVDFNASDSANWQCGRSGERFLEATSFRALSRSVEAAEHGRRKRAIDLRDASIRVYTAIVATIAALASLLAVFLKR